MINVPLSNKFLTGSILNNTYTQLVDTHIGHTSENCIFIGQYKMFTFSLNHEKEKKCNEMVQRVI